MVVDPTQFLQLFVNGLIVGSVLALAAAGLSLVYGILDLANFAHGDLITLGTYLGLFFAVLSTLSVLIRWALVIALGFILLAALDRWLRPLAASRWDRIGGEPALSTNESMVSVYAGLLLIAMVAGVTYGLEWASGTSLSLAAALSLAGVLGEWWNRKEANPGSEAWIAGSLAGVPVAAVLLVFVVGPLTGWTISWMWGIALGLSIPITMVVARIPGVLGGPTALFGIGMGVLVAALLLSGEFLLATVLALVLVGVGSMVLDGVIWRPMRRRGAGLLTLIIISIGLALVIRNGVIITWGTGVVSYPGFGGGPLQLLSGVLITRSQLIVIGVTVATIVAVHVLLRHTRMGKAMRALADDIDLARVTGIDVDRVILYVWFIAGALAALAGVLLGTLRPFTTSLGWFLLLPIFAAVILGGIGSPYGAMAGGFVIGVGMETSLAFGVPSDYRLAVGFSIMILVLVFRPSGIFGGEATR